jgi:hypothetical protein
MCCIETGLVTYASMPAMYGNTQTTFSGVDKQHRLLIISPGAVWYMAWLPSVAVAWSLLDKAYPR